MLIIINDIMCALKSIICGIMLKILANNHSRYNSMMYLNIMELQRCEILEIMGCEILEI